MITFDFDTERYVPVKIKGTHEYYAYDREVYPSIPFDEFQENNSKPLVCYKVSGEEMGTIDLSRTYTLPFAVLDIVWVKLP
jgi:hypothetical protein